MFWNHPDWHLLLALPFAIVLITQASMSDDIWGPGETMRGFWGRLWQEYFDESFLPECRSWRAPQIQFRHSKWRAGAPPE